MAFTRLTLLYQTRSRPPSFQTALLPGRLSSQNGSLPDESPSRCLSFQMPLLPHASPSRCLSFQMALNHRLGSPSTTGPRKLTFELTGPLRWAGIWVGIWAKAFQPKWRGAAMGPVQRMLSLTFEAPMRGRQFALARSVLIVDTSPRDGFRYCQPAFRHYRIVRLGVVLSQSYFPPVVKTNLPLRRPRRLQ